MKRIACLLVLVIAAGALPAQIPNPQKVMITEVFMGSCCEAIELTNFGTAPADLTGHTLRYLNSVVTVSNPIGVTVAPGESIVVGENGGIWPVPPGTQVIGAFPIIGSSTEPVAVALFDAVLVNVDEVRIRGTDGSWNLGTGFNGAFRGFVNRSALSTAGGVERIWGLDSDAGADWTEEPGASLGRENLSSGPRGSDTTGTQAVFLTEIDDSPDLIEIQNQSGGAVNLLNWFLVCSGAQNQALAVIRPWPSSVILLNQGYHVLGEGPAPAEKPAPVYYIDVTALGFNLPFTTAEYTVGLYDQLGHLVDLVRTTGHDDGVAHNFPRAPAPWNAFAGAVQRTPGGSGAIGRTPGFPYQGGSGWRSVYTRTMGSANTTLFGAPGISDFFDARLNEGSGDGLTILLNAGSGRAGFTYSFLFSLGHLDGLGPVFGLGPEALAYWQVVLGSPPFSGPLNAQGAMRLDLDAGILPPGFTADLLFVLQDPAGAFAARTAILELDV